MYLVSVIEGKNGARAYLYEKHSASFLWCIRLFAGKRWLETFDFYSLPESANEELHIALERAEEVTTNVE